MDSFPGQRSNLIGSSVCRELTPFKPSSRAWITNATVVNNMTLRSTLAGWRLCSIVVATATCQTVPQSEAPGCIWTLTKKKKTMWTLNPPQKWIWFEPGSSTVSKQPSVCFAPKTAKKLEIIKCLCRIFVLLTKRDDLFYYWYQSEVSYSYYGFFQHTDPENMKSANCQL